MLNPFFQRVSSLTCVLSSVCIPLSQGVVPVSSMSASFLLNLCLYLCKTADRSASLSQSAPQVPSPITGLPARSISGGSAATLGAGQGAADYERYLISVTSQSPEAVYRSDKLLEAAEAAGFKDLALELCVKRYVFCASDIGYAYHGSPD